MIRSLPSRRRPEPSLATEPYTCFGRAIVSAKAGAATKRAAAPKSPTASPRSRGAGGLGADLRHAVAPEGEIQGEGNGEGDQFRNEIADGPAAPEPDDEAHRAEGEPRDEPGVGEDPTVLLTPGGDQLRRIL